MTLRRTPFSLSVSLFLLVLAIGPISVSAHAAETAETKDYRQAVDRAIQFLQTKAQEPDGAFASYAGPGVTAVVASGLLRNGLTPDDPMVAKALAYLEGFVQPDGGIHAKKTLYRNYETCLAIVVFSEANRDGRYDKLIKDADRFVKEIQWDEGENHSLDSYNFGGAGYGKHTRPDLSNTSFLIAALRAAGNGPDDPAMQKALTFVSRCQNLESTYNTTRFSAKNPDGGFYYTCAGGGQSQAGETPTGGLRSYGSMTYAGLKSMIYAGVKSDDPRVKAALNWIQKHYMLDANPEMGSAGLYYYYQTFAKALAAAGLDQVEDVQGKSHNWREDLVAELVRRQQPDGSWVNTNPRWFENNPSLVTGYALLALSYCRPDT
ncbi:MAG: terpene cyclase/mutase family protein, partial [Pirellulales bacterium]|nr:terpene cyclase/mutase family protein [Pirellulales bacterium]